MSKAKTKAKNTNRQITLVSTYIKDCSFEAKLPAQAYADQPWDPDVKVDMRSLFNKVGENLWEAVLIATLSVSLKDNVIFTTEVHQGSTLFFEGEYSEEERNHHLNVNAMQDIFPYLRFNLSDLVIRGGYPPLYINQIDFESEYKKRLANAKKSSEKSETK